MSANDAVKVTRELIFRGATSETGGWSRRQFEILGLPYPPPSGWIKECCNKYLPRELVDEFLSLKKGARYAQSQMPFGKYKGVQINQVPSDYLRWVLENCHKLNLTLRDQISSTLRDRGEAVPDTQRPKNYEPVPASGDHPEVEVPENRLPWGRSDIAYDEQDQEWVLVLAPPFSAPALLSGPEAPDQDKPHAFLASEEIPFDGPYTN